jgi:adenine-specific DNA methylase
MLQRYLGNKTSLTTEIIEIIGTVAEPGSRVCDAFAGSLAVSVALRKAGYVVSANDINLLSWVYGNAFLANSTLPQISLAEILGKNAEHVRAAGQKMFDDGLYVFDEWKNTASQEAIADFAGLVAHLYSPYTRSDIPRNARRTDFYEHYCEDGTRSSFESSRGSKGNRRFLSPVNAASLDRAMSRIRFWVRKGNLSEKARCVLTAIILDSVEKVANIQGTYHDFPRDFYDPRALKPITALLPSAENFSIGPPAQQIGKALDSLEFVKTIQPQDVLYLDPPYNFRQYTSYYFLPNLIAEYPDIDDLDSYFSEIQFVRGQNMKSEFSSTFCSSKGFLPSLADLVKSTPCDYVVLSYFNGKNHWNSFKSGTCNRGQEELEKFFQSELFESGSVRLVPVSRLNYQSYGGHKALEVSEYLFLAKKSQNKIVNVLKEEYALV